MNVQPFRIPTYSDVSVIEISDEELHDLECLSYDELFAEGERLIQEGERLTHKPVNIYNDDEAGWNWIDFHA